MIPEEYKQNIHVRLSTPLIGFFVLSLIMTIISFFMLFIADIKSTDLYGNLDDWKIFNVYLPYVTVIAFVLMIINMKKAPDEPREYEENG